VQRCEICDPFFGLLPIVRVDDRDPVSNRQRIQEIKHAIFVILIETSSGVAVWERPFNDKKTRGKGQQLFEFMKKGQAIVGGIRVNRREYLHGDTFDAQEFRYFSNGIAAGGKGLSNGSGDPDEALEVVRELLPRIDVEMDGRYQGCRLTLP